MRFNHNETHSELISMLGFLVRGKDTLSGSALPLHFLKLYSITCIRDNYQERFVTNSSGVSGDSEQKQQKSGD